MSRGADIVILDELLLLADHILQVDDCASLELQVEQELHVLGLQEVVLDDKFQVVLVVLHLDPITVAN